MPGHQSALSDAQVCSFSCQLNKITHQIYNTSKQQQAHHIRDCQRPIFLLLTTDILPTTMAKADEQLHQKCSGTSRSPCSADGSTSPSWNLTNPASNWRSQHRSHRFGLPHVRHRPQKRECEGGSCRARFLGIPCFCGHSTKTSCAQTIQSTS